MKIEVRTPGKNDTDWEAVAGVGVIPLFFAVCAVLVKWLPGFLPRCRFHDLTGIPCPGCGSLRCAEALLRGRPADAFFAQPLMFAAVASGAAYSLYSAAVFLFRLPRLRPVASRREWKALAAATAAAVLANWTYLIIAGD